MDGEMTARAVQVEAAFAEHERVVSAMRSSADDVLRAAGMVAEAIRGGGKVVACGNGGSAADAQHLAAELVGRFLRERTPWPAIALNANSSAVTAIGNDYGFDETFARQVAAHGRAGDVLVAISTSGTSPNVLRAAEVARGLGMRTIGMTGASGGTLADVVDVCLKVPSDETPRIQEGHVLLLHLLCGLVEDACC